MKILSRLGGLVLAAGARKGGQSVSTGTRGLYWGNSGAVSGLPGRLCMTVCEQQQVRFNSSVRNFTPDRIRNVAIIAHVDHGKTTLVDGLLGQSDTKALSGIGERVMDSNALEKERGITILSKCTSVVYKDHLLNIVDTPGHADFGGEVERIMSMVDGVVLVVDASDGPMTQTKFVLKKALQKGVKPLVVMNKVDRPTSRPAEVENEILELFFDLEASDDQLDYKLLYASAKLGWAVPNMNDEKKDLKCILESIISAIPAPNADPSAPFKMLVTQLDSNEYVGKLLLGRIQSGTVNVGDVMKCLSVDGNTVCEGRVMKLFSRIGLDQVAVESAVAGDIVSIAGFGDGTVANTICDPSINEAIAADPIDPPTLSIAVSTNSSPLMGREGTYVTNNHIKERLMKEIETNVALQCIVQSEHFELRGRGELQLSVLIETMRREGFEVSISSPKVVFQNDENGNVIEPIERVVIDVANEYCSQIIEKLTTRKGELVNYDPSGDERSRLEVNIPSRGLIGYRSEFVNDTRGTGILNASFEKYVPYVGPISKADKGALISMTDGDTTTYALSAIEPRGILFVGPSETVYAGMVIGEHSRDNDLLVNPVRAKQLTNMRASGKDDFVRLTPPKKMTLEEMIAYIREDECIEVTPQNLRLRKINYDGRVKRK
eukprot:Nk52_evm12s284 gene=Nk52_evmTU12s284